MTIKVNCTGCGKSLKAPDSAAGRRAKCPQCGTVTVLPKLDNLDVVEVLDPIMDPEPVDDAAPEQPFSPLDEALAQQAPAQAESGAYDLDAPAPAAAPAAGNTEMRRPCPMCGEMIPVAAIKCRFCGEIFDPTLKKANQKSRGNAPSTDSTLSIGELLFGILCGGLGCIVGIIWMIQGKPKGIKLVGLSIGSVFIWNVIFQVINMASHQ